MLGLAALDSFLGYGGWGADLDVDPHATDVTLTVKLPNSFFFCHVNYSDQQFTVTDRDCFQLSEVLKQNTNNKIRQLKCQNSGEKNHALLELAGN